MRKLLAVLFLIVITALSTPSQKAHAQASPTPYPFPGNHIPTWQSQEGCYHSTNSGCPAPSPASTAQANTDYANLANHVDYLQGDQRNANYAQGAGIHEMPYLDPGLVHGADPSSYPQYLAAKDGAGLLMFVPNANSGTGGSLQGDPTNPMAVSYWSNQCSAQLQNSFGRYGFSNCFLDDQIAPWQQAAFTAYCEGTFALSGGTPYTCQGTGGTQNAYGPLLNHYPYPQPYPSYWLSGVANLYRSMPVPSFINLAFMDPTERPYWLGPNNNNVEGVVCENCVGRNFFAGDAWHSSTDWINEVNAEIVAEEDGVKFVSYDLDSTSTTDMIYNYASTYLGMLDPKLTVIYEEWDSPLTAPTSGNVISNLTYIIPTGPYGANPSFDPLATNYNPNTPSIAVGVGSFLTPTGAYAREFSDCFVNGTDKGPCAAVVNPNAFPVGWPRISLRNTYAHTATGVNTNGVVFEPGFGDHGGTINLPSITGNPPPNTLGANTGVIAFL